MNQSRQTEPDLSAPLIVRWQFNSRETLNFIPAVSTGRVYLPLAAGIFVCLNSNGGELNWRTELGGEISASPVADANGVYLASSIGRQNTPLTSNQIERKTTSSPGGAVRALSQQNGVTLWMHTLSSPIQGSFAQTTTALLAGSTDGQVYSFNKMTGQILWQKKLSNSAFNSQPAIGHETLFMGNDDGSVYAMDIKSGDTRWRYRTHGSVRGQLVISDETVFFGSADGKVYALDSHSGKLVWSKRTGAGVQSVAANSTALIVASLDNFVYSLSASKGKLLWKRQLAGRIISPPLIHGSNVVLTPLASIAAVVLNLSEGKQINLVQLAEDDATGTGAVFADSLLMLTTRKGLIAYGHSTQSPATAKEF